MKKDIHAQVIQQIAIALKIPRIRREILARPELLRIDEDRDHDAIATRLSIAHQTKMPFMEKTHGRNQDDALALAPLSLAPLTHVGNMFDDLHGPSSDNWSTGVMERWSQCSITPFLPERLLLR